MLFLKPNIEKMQRRGDVRGLLKVVTKSRNYTLERDAYAALVMLGKNAVEPLLDCLKHRGSRGAGAARALGDIGDHRAVEALIKILQTSSIHDDLSAWNAAKALGKIGDSRAVESLISALRREHPYGYQLQKYAAQALGAIGDSRAVQPLVEVLKLSAKDQRETMRKVLNRAKFGYSDSITGALGASKEYERDPEQFDWRFGARVAAAEALGKIGDASAIPFLQAATQTDHREVRRVAQEALAKLMPLPSAQVIPVTAPSRFWRCPKCSAILQKKDGNSGALPLSGAVVVGWASCGKCGASTSREDVYAGNYDLPEIRLNCPHCATLLQGPAEDLLGKPCPSCGRQISKKP